MSPLRSRAVTLTLVTLATFTFVGCSTGTPVTVSPTAPAPTAPAPTAPASPAAVNDPLCAALLTMFIPLDSARQGTIGDLPLSMFAELADTTGDVYAAIPDRRYAAATSSPAVQAATADMFTLLASLHYEAADMLRTVDTHRDDVTTFADVADALEDDDGDPHVTAAFAAGLDLLSHSLQADVADMFGTTTDQIDKAVDYETQARCGEYLLRSSH